jgi:hypothetical protein
MPSLMIATNGKNQPKRSRQQSAHVLADLLLYYMIIWPPNEASSSSGFACRLAGKATGNQNFRGQADKEIEKSIKNSFFY